MNMKFSACGIEDMPNLDTTIAYLHLIVYGNDERHFFNIPTTITWSEMINIVFDGHTPQHLTYLDEENDMIQLGSQSEWEEAIKVGQIRERVLSLFSEPSEPSGFDIVLSEQDKIVKSQPTPERRNAYGFLTDDEEEEISPTDEPVDMSTGPPQWFVTYMEKFKQDISCEIARKVNRKLHKLIDNGDLVFSDRKMRKPGVLPYAEKLGSSKPTGLPRLWRGLDLGLHHSGSDNLGSDSLPCSPEPLSRPWPEAQPGIFNSPAGLIALANLGQDNVMCQKCNKQIDGVWYKCGHCASYDLCAACEAVADDHCSNHIFLKLPKPSNACLNKRTPIEDNFARLRRMIVEEADKNARKTMESKIRKESLKKSVQTTSEATSQTTGCNTNKVSLSGILPAIEALKPGIKDTGFLFDDRALKPVKSTMDAKFLFDETVPDGTKFSPGTQFTKQWRMVNFGSKPWDGNTKLKFLWGTKGFTPLEMEVPVPNLLPRQNGSISVQYVAPTKPGFYESHWNFTHKKHMFGHRIWCSIEVVDPNQSTYAATNEESIQLTEVQEPENGERHKLNESYSNKNESADDFEKTSANPLDSLSSKDSESRILDQFEMPNLSADNNNAAAVGDSELASVINLSSSSSDSEFEVVPMPLCFTLPFKQRLDESKESPAIFSGMKRSSTSSSVVFLSPDGEESPSEVQFDGNTSSAKFHMETGVFQAEDGECNQAAANLECKLEELSKTFNDLAISEEGDEEEAETGAASSAARQRRRSLETGETFPIEKPVTFETGSNPFSKQSGNSGINVTELAYPTANHNYLQTSPGAAKPDGLVSVAASIFNSARSALSAMQWVPIPPDDNGDFIAVNSIYSPRFQFPVRSPVERLTTNTLEFD